MLEFWCELDALSQRIDLFVGEFQLRVLWDEFEEGFLSDYGSLCASGFRFDNLLVASFFQLL